MGEPDPARALGAGADARRAQHALRGPGPSAEERGDPPARRRACESRLMRQIARRLKDGSLELVEVPDPRPGAGQVSVRVAASVVSAGTERATMEAAQKSLLAKAR